MPSTPHTLNEVIAHLEHALHTHGGFRWRIANQPCPDGRYLIDWRAKTIYLDSRLTGDETFAAYIAVCVELDADSAYYRGPQLVPHAVAARDAAARIAGTTTHATARPQFARVGAPSAPSPMWTPMTPTDPPDLHTDRAHSARIYDYLLGGKDNYAPDRAAGDATLAAHPDMRGLALSQRGFMHRTAAAVAAAGIDQFLDLGTGIPTEPNLHQIVQRINPAARVVYVDNDPIVLVHALALTNSTTQGRVAYLQADVRDPDSILTAPLLVDTLDLTRPVGVSLIGLSHFLDDDAIATVLAAVRRRMVSGSHLTINVGTVENDPDGRVDRIMAAYRTAGIPTYVRTHDEVAALMDGLELLDPGIVSTLRWRPDPNRPPADADLHLHWGVVGRVP